MTEKMIVEMDQVIYANLVQIYVNQYEGHCDAEDDCGDGSGNLCKSYADLCASV